MLHFTLPLPHLLACLEWLFAHQNALLSSAQLLGGDRAVRRVARLIEAAPHQTAMTRSFARELDWLHGLLTLRNVDDPESTEALHFAAIDPAHPVIWEICSLSEALANHIAAAIEEAQHVQAKAKGA